MGKLDQFAKDTFAEETLGITHGGADFQPPTELNLSEVRLDGMLLVRDAAKLLHLPAPWCQTGEHDEIVLEVKMQGDHLDMPPIRRTLLRRQAREVQRTELSEPLWDGEEPLWVVASHVPEVLNRRRKLRRVGPGCHRVDTGVGAFSFLWIAANDLP